MNTYEQLLSSSDENIIVIEKNFKSHAKGLCKGNKIGISKTISTSAEKACILAEELGHHYTTVGNILSQESVSNQKQELRARMWAYNKLIGLMGIIKSYEPMFFSNKDIISKPVKIIGKVVELRGKF